MAPSRFSGAAALGMTPAEVQQLLNAAVARGADPEQAREHFMGHPATDPLTRFLLARVNPRYKNESDLTLAVSLDLTEIAAEKLDEGADPNVCAIDGTTPLMDAAMHGNHQLAALLLSAGARVSVRNQSGQTPLRFAASNGADEVVRMLLKAGADFREQGLLTAASNRCSPEILKGLLELGLDANEDGGQPLLNATATRSFENMKFLIEHRANVNARGYKARTPLIMATRDDNENLPADFKMVQVLLQHGADVNAKDEDGWTPLMGAARDGDARVVRLLLENGADPAARDNNNNTPLLLAIAQGNTEIANLIRENLTGK